MMDSEDINNDKAVFVHEWFVETADVNYLLARFCRTTGMQREAWWQIQQALEKYLKAGLVLNGISVKKLGHDLLALWDSHLAVFKDLPVADPVKPAQLHDDFWHDTRAEEFLRRVEMFGNTDARYGLTSFSNQDEDIFILDHLVFELRRRAIGLDWIVGATWPEPDLAEFEGRSFRDVLIERPKYQVRELSPSRMKFDRIGEDVSDALFAWNYAFQRRPEDLARPAPRTVVPLIAVRNALISHIQNEMQSGTISRRTAMILQWAIDSIKLDKAFAAEAKQLIEQQHPDLKK